MEGMQAWVSAYHGHTQSSACNYNGPQLTLIIYYSDMHSDSLQLTSGVIWTALNIDYPGHSFSHLGIFWGEDTKV